MAERRHAHRRDGTILIDERGEEGRRRRGQALPLAVAGVDRRPPQQLERRRGRHGQQAVLAGDRSAADVQV